MMPQDGRNMEPSWTDIQALAKRLDNIDRQLTLIRKILSAHTVAIQANQPPQEWSGGTCDLST